MEKLLISIGEVLSMEIEEIEQVRYEDSGAYSMTLCLKGGECVRLQLSSEY